MDKLMDLPVSENFLQNTGENRIAGMVVLYNSKLDVLSNIKTYINQVEKLYVIDNSDQPNLRLINAIKVLDVAVYMPSMGNLGIAHALNIAANQAINDGFTHLLTMDDDSRAPSRMVDIMNSFLNAYADRNKVGIISAIHDSIRAPEYFRTVLYTMTSGNLLSLAVYRQVGGFWEELFIDHVDHEYGLRLNEAGYQVLELPGLLLNHSLGHTKSISRWSGRSHFISHQPIRMYYIARNGWLVAKKYPHFRWTAVKLIAKEWIKSMFWENERRKRICFLLKGIIDARSGRMGKLTPIDNS